MPRYTILVDSSKRTNGTCERFSWNLTPQLSFPSQLIINKVIIPCANYYINSTNNTFIMNIAGTPNTVTVTVGNYDGATLAAELKSQLDTATGEVWTVTMDSSTYKLTFAVGSGTTKYFDFGSKPAAAKYLGFGYTPNITSTTTSSTFTTTYTSPYACQLFHNSYYIHADFTGKTIYNNGAISDILVTVPVDQSTYPNGSVIVYEPNIEFVMRTDLPQDLQFFNVYITDDYGNDIDMNGAQWSFEMDIVTIS